jgi:hypothetical protein
MTELFRKVEFKELGPDRQLREPSAAAMFRIRKLRKKAEAGEEVDAEQFAIILSACVVDGSGKLVYPSEADAAKALEDIPSRVLGALMERFAELSGTAEKKDETPPGNWQGSQSGS